MQPADGASNNVWLRRVRASQSIPMLAQRSGNGWLKVKLNGQAWMWEGSTARVAIHDATQDPTRTPPSGCMLSYLQ